MRASVPAAVLAAALAASAGSAPAQVFPVLQGDPVDGLGRAHCILPGVPLITENEDEDFNPPVVHPETIGDVDLVIRTGTVAPGATMPPPALVPPVAAAGGSRFPGGIDVPFTVIVSDGDPTEPGGHPLLGPEMNGIPVLVVAFADLDGDGFVGPTGTDPEGTADDGREMQESSFPVGMRVAYFTNGVAQGVIASDVGAPAAAGGLLVVLTASAYVGQFSPDFFLGTVPDGPGIATLLPFFPRFEPDRVIDTDGSAGLALPDGRIAIEFEDEFDPPVNHPLLGTPFALPTDGSSVTIDRVSVRAGVASRPLFVRPSSAAGLDGEEDRLPLRPDAAGVLVEPLPQIGVTDDGPGNGVPARLVPVDVLGNVSDPTVPLDVRVVASSGLVITQPDIDADPSEETLPLGSAAGVLVTVDDAGGAGDSGVAGTITLEVDGFAVERLAVLLSGGPPVGTAPAVTHASLLGSAALSRDCRADRTLVAIVDDPDGDADSVTATLSMDGTSLGTVTLEPSPLAPPPGAPAGAVFAASLRLPASVVEAGTLVVSLVARDAASLVSAPFVLDVPVVAAAPPQVTSPIVTPVILPAGKRTKITVTATVTDDCALRRVTAQRERNGTFKRLVRLNDRGRRGDASAGDGVFTGTRKVRAPSEEEALSIRVQAKDRTRQTTVSDAVVVPVAP